MKDFFVFALFLELESMNDLVAVVIKSSFLFFSQYSRVFLISSNASVKDKYSRTVEGKGFNIILNLCSVCESNLFKYSY